MGGGLEATAPLAHFAVTVGRRTRFVKLEEIGQERAWEFLDQQAFLSVAWDGELADQAALAFVR
jgi:hypothetical protein